MVDLVLIYNFIQIFRVKKSHLSLFRILTKFDNELLMSLHNVNIQMLIERIMQESHVGLL